MQNYDYTQELDEELTIDLKKIFFALWSRKTLIVKVFLGVLVFFVLLTFVSPKKYKVEADLYINKAQNSNMMDINPFVLEELGAGGGGVAALMSGGGGLTNELELIQSPLVIDRVIRENNLVYRKKYGFLPNKKEGEYISTAAFLGNGKNLSFENKKGTNVLTIEYKSGNPELAYNIVNSIITNYIALHKELHSEKSKSDKKIIEKQYNLARKSFESTVKKTDGLPEQALVSSGQLSALSAFSHSAQKALSNLKGQVIRGEKAKLDLTEEASKVASLSSKLEWAKMVEEMSDSSKVLVLKEPQKLRDFEYASPKLLINILLGIVFGVIASLFAVIFVENTDKKLTYSMLGDNIIYDGDNDFTDIKVQLLANKDNKIACVFFEDLNSLSVQLKDFSNVSFINADISSEFVDKLSQTKDVILFATINKTDSKLYKQIKQMLSEMNKTVILEVLV